MYRINYLSHNWLVHHIHNRVFRRKKAQIKGLVIDLGCGVSPYRKEVTELGCQYVGVDWSNSIHKVKPDVVADLTQTFPFEDESADTLLSFQVLEHLPTPQEFLAECFRVLRPGGALFLTVPFQWRVHEAPYDYFRYTPFGLEHLLTRAGFTDLTIEEMGGFWYTWILKWNYFLYIKLAVLPLRIVATPFFFINQVIALFFDKIITSKQEAGGYVVIARK